MPTAADGVSVSAPPKLQAETFSLITLCVAFTIAVRVGGSAMVICAWLGYQQPGEIMTP
jgi:hypothetical protein